MKRSLSAFISICSWLLKNEKELVRRARAANIICIRPSAIVSVVFAIFYIIARADLIPEGLIRGVVGLIDDVAIGIIALIYIFSEVMYCSGVNIVKKAINLPDYDAENVLDKDEEDEPAAQPNQPQPTNKVASLWDKLKNFGGGKPAEEEDSEDYFE